MILSQISCKAHQIENTINSRIREYLNLKYSNKIVDIEMIVQSMVNLLVEDARLQYIFKHLIRDYITKLITGGRDQRVPHQMENVMIKQKIHRWLERMIKKQYQKYKKNINYIELQDEQETNSICQLKNSQDNCIVLHNQIVQSIKPPAFIDLDGAIVQPFPMRQRSHRKIKLKPQLQIVLKQARQMQNQIANSSQEFIFPLYKKYDPNKNASTIKRQSVKAIKHKKKTTKRIPQMQKLKMELKKTDKYGHLLMGDQIKIIQRVYEVGEAQKQQMAVIQWKYRSSGFKPDPSSIELELLKYLQPDTLMRYLQTNKRAKKII